MHICWVRAMLADFDRERHHELTRQKDKVEARRERIKKYYATPWKWGYESEEFSSEDDLEVSNPKEWHERNLATESQSLEILTMAKQDVACSYTQVRRSERQQTKRIRHYDEHTYIRTFPTLFDAHIRKGKCLDILVRRLQKEFDHRQLMPQFSRLTFNRWLEEAWTEVDGLSSEEEDTSDAETLVLEPSDDELLAKVAQGGPKPSKQTSSPPSEAQSEGNLTTDRPINMIRSDGNKTTFENNGEVMYTRYRLRSHHWNSTDDEEDNQGGPEAKRLKSTLNR